MTSFHIDWLKTYQDFDSQLPFIGKTFLYRFDSLTGAQIGSHQPIFKYTGSYSTTLKITISGNRITVDGNPSRVNRLDNLFGFTTLDQCYEVFNTVLDSLGLPRFTKATKSWYRLGDDGSRFEKVTDGAVIQEIHVNTNLAVGSGNEKSYLSALSILPFRNLKPNLHPNARTVDWLSPDGSGAYLYPSVYMKAEEIIRHSLKKIRRLFGENSNEHNYLLQLINFCKTHGVVRPELKIKSAFLRKYNLSHYGLIDESFFKTLHTEFVNLNQKIQVNHMDLETITEELLRKNVCTNIKSANATSLYAIQWMNGHKFDLTKRAVQTHRARLRKINIDISLECDVKKFSLVKVKELRSIEVTPLVIPDWYQKPKVNHLKSVA